MKALLLRPFRNTTVLQHLQGPSYLYALLTDPRIVSESEETTSGSPKLLNEAVSQVSAGMPFAVSVDTLSEDVLEVSGYAFTRIGNLEPFRDEAGLFQEFMPQAEYGKAGLLPLNHYGKGPFCRFCIPETYPLRGVYALVTNGRPVYVGKTVNLSRRFNQGYGVIAPINCYVGGQSTNCKINHRVLKLAQVGSPVTLWFHRTNLDDRIENELIGALRPDWNGAYRL